MAESKGTGLKKETAGALAYVLGPITGIIFLIMEKDSFVRFHAMQSIVVSGVWLVLSFLMAPIGLILGITVILVWLVPLLGGILSIGGFVLYLLLIYKAWQGEEWEVPVLGKFARQMVKKA